MTTYRAIAASFVLALLTLPAPPSQAGPPREQQYNVRDAVADDVLSIYLVRTPDGWREVISYEAKTSDDEHVAYVTSEAEHTGPPDTNQINALIAARLAQLNARLDEKFPGTGPPNPLIGGGGGGGRKP